MKSSLLIDHSHLFLALRFRAERDAAEAKAERLGIATGRLFRRRATHAQRERTVRFPGGETITSNLKS